MEGTSSLWAELAVIRCPVDMGTGTRRGTGDAISAAGF